MRAQVEGHIEAFLDKISTFNIIALHPRIVAKGCSEDRIHRALECARLAIPSLGKQHDLNSVINALT
ncbi:MAG: hypothetical protein ABSA11_04065 [Candidatus Bathyarchaeia archaeon]|jgi:hypothetical protein